MWISRKKWNSLKAEIESQKIIKEATDKTLNEYRDRNELLIKMVNASMEQLCLSEKWMRTRDEITGRFKKHKG